MDMYLVVPDDAGPSMVTGKLPQTVLKDWDDGLCGIYRADSRKLWALSGHEGDWHLEWKEVPLHPEMWQSMPPHHEEAAHGH